MLNSRATLAWVSGLALRDSRSVISSAITFLTSSGITALLLYSSVSQAMCRSKRSSALRINSR